MRNFLALVVVNAVLLTGIVANAAAVRDQTCTRKDGSTYQCSIGMLHRAEHMKACGAEWRNAKSDPAVKSAGWPAYWHTCSQTQKALDTAKRD